MDFSFQSQNDKIDELFINKHTSHQDHIVQNWM